MADDRDRMDWLRTMTATAYLVRAFDGAELDPYDMLPRQLRPPKPPEPPVSPEREKHDTDCALLLIGEALKLRS